MPQILRPAATAAVAAAMLTGAPVAPFAVGKAEARDWRGDRHWGRHRHRDRVDAGDIIAGAIIIGGIAAIASGISKADRDKDDWDRDARFGYEDRTDAVDICARAAEDEARRDAPRAYVRTIDSVSNSGARYRVKGTVEVERPRGWDRDKPGTYTDRVRFSCTARNGSIVAFRFEDSVASRW